MKYFVYVLGSNKNKKIKTYVGYTSNLKKRLKLHNSGKGAKSTRGRKWKIIYKEIIKSKNKAMSREYYLKKNTHSLQSLVLQYYKKPLENLYSKTSLGFSLGSRRQKG